MPQKLTRTQRRVLHALCEKQPQKISELALSIGKSQKAASDAVNIVEAKGYVVTETAEDEPGRPKYVSLTAKGEEMCKELVKSESAPQGEQK